MRTVKRRIEIIAVERERFITQAVAMTCPVCYLSTEMLTARQAGTLIQVKPQTIRRWLASGKAHGVKTPGGHLRICRNSLFLPNLVAVVRYEKRLHGATMLPPAL